MSDEPYQPRMTDGKENPKYVDLLEEDKPIANQKYVCVLSRRKDPARCFIGEVPKGVGI